VERQVVLAPQQAERLLLARAEARSRATVSPDLGLSEVEAALDAEGVVFPGGERVSWENLETIRDSKASGRLTGHCFIVEDGGVRQIEVYSREFDRYYSLMPTQGAPTMLISGIPMHRIKGTDPHRDTLEKVRAAAPVMGRVLDTTTGLGYTAIEAARTARAVVTIELDPAVLELGRMNPWSRELFENPRITQLVGDSAERIREFRDEEFDRILHDPPTFSLAGQLYGGEFYRELYRVLRRGGRLFHYIGDPQSKLGGRVTRGVVRRLQESGFKRVVPRPEAFGVVAFK
jgi:predicted methyltransferase